MTIQEFSPFNAIEHALARWWILVVFAVAGGGGGWLFHQSQPAIYESQTELIITINLNSGTFLSQYDEDLMLGATGNIILSAHIVDGIVKLAQNQGLDIDLPTIQRTFSVERRHEAWVLKVRNSDPQTAAALTNLWAGLVYLELTQALDHAIRAEQIQAQITALETSLTVLIQAQTTEPASRDCGGCSLSEIQTQIGNLSEQLVLEKQQTLSIQPRLEFAPPTSAPVPEKPVLYGQGSLVLAGAFIGFIISLWVASINIGKRND